MPMGVHLPWQPFPSHCQGLTRGLNFSGTIVLPYDAHLNVISTPWVIGREKILNLSRKSVHNEQKTVQLPAVGG